MITLKILAATLAATFAAAAYAAGPYGPGPGCAGASADCPADGTGAGPRAGRHAERLRAADTNGDGLISREEAQASLPGLAGRFDAIDLNKDGQLSADELQAARGTFRTARGEGWKKWDANGDGKLSREEVASAPRLSQQFDAIDTNHDGFLTVEELRAAHGGFAGRGRNRPS